MCLRHCRWPPASAAASSSAKHSKGIVSKCFALSPPATNPSFPAPCPPAAGLHPPSFDALLSLLRLCGRQKALHDGRKLHSHIACRGYDRSTFLSNAIIQCYAKCGNVQEAKAVFDIIPSPNVFSWNLLIVAYGHNGHVDDAWKVFSSMPTRNVVSWNVMIGTYAQNGHAREALGIFHWMYVEGPNPDNVTFVSALDACASLAAQQEGSDNYAYMGYEHAVDSNASTSLFGRCQDLVALQEAHGMHAMIIDMEYEHDAVIGNALINTYGKCGNVQDGRSLFHRIQHPNVITWTAIIATFSQNGNSGEALEFFKRMTLEGIGPNNVTFACALDACSSLADLEEGKYIHAVILNSEYKEDLLVGNALVSMYGKCKSVYNAENVFTRMHCWDIVSWNAMIATFSQNGRAEEALKFFRQMQFKGIKPDRITFVCALDACASLLALEEGKKLHALIVMIGCEHLGVVGSALISMYGNCRVVHEAQSVFDRIHQQDLVSWNAMIAAFALNEYGKEALDLFHQMKLGGLKADKITFCGVLDACANLAAIEEGREIHSVINSSGYDEDVMVGTALLDMYGKCGSVLEAKAVFKTMLQRNVITWTAMIAALAQNGDGREAMDLFSEMLIAGIQPDTITFISIFNACSHIGLVEEGVHFFASMKRHHGLDHTLDHYLPMIDLLGRAGCLDEAEVLIHNMPIEEVGVSWECLLAACRVHGDFVRGFRAANHCFELEPKKAAPFVTLDNICAGAVNPTLISTARHWEGLWCEAAA